MQNYFIHNNQRIYIHIEPQIGPSGRPFRLSGIAKNSQKPSKWINKVENWHWIYTFRYIDNLESFEGFEIETDYYDKKIRFNKIIL